MVMEYRGRTNGWLAFFEHWWFLSVAVSALVACQALSFFENLSGASWIHCLELTFVLLLSGTGLIIYAKTPVYRSGQFFTFGIKSIPQNFRRFYRWGWRTFLLGVALSLCLLLSWQ
jgi:hypothetical protein